MNLTEAQESINQLVDEHRDQLEHASGGQIVSPAELRQIIADRQKDVGDIKTVDLQGWDTVSGVTFEMMNKSIIQQKTSPKTFKQEDQRKDGTVEAWITGEFGNWSLYVGGEGEIIAISVPITEGEYSVFTGQQKLDPCIVQIQVNAKYYPHTDNPNQQKLTVDKDKAVTVMSMDPAPQDSLAKGVVKQMLENWFNDHLGVFEPVFATVDVGAQYEQRVAWMKPSFQSYAVNVPETEPQAANSVFGIPTLIDGESAPANLTAQISPYVMPTDCVATFALSRKRFLEHYLKPVVHLMFEKAQPEDFDIDNDDGSITNNKKLTLQPVEMDDHKVTPEVETDHFSIEVDEDHLVVKLENVSVSLSGWRIGHTLIINYTQKFKMELDSAGSIVLVGDIATMDCHVEESEWLVVTQIVLAASSIILGILGGGLMAFGRSGLFALEAVDGGLQATAVAANPATVTATADATAMAAAGADAAADAVKFTQMGLRIQYVAKVAMMLSGVTATLGGITGVVTGIEKLGWDNEKLNFKKLMDDAIQKTVIWPDGIDNLELKTVGLRNSLVFGYAQKQTAGA